MTTAPPDAQRRSFLDFFSYTPPSPRQLQGCAQRCVLPATGPCCLLHKPRFKAQSDPYPVAHLSIVQHPPFPTPTPTTPAPPCPGQPAVSERFCSRGTADRTFQDGQSKIRKAAGNFPLMQTTQLFTIQGKEGPVSRRCSIKAYVLQRSGTPGASPLHSHIPGDENLEQRLSDTEDSEEMNKGREGPSTISSG